jgi:hypothetical protein
VGRGVKREWVRGSGEIDGEGVGSLGEDRNGKCWCEGESEVSVLKWGV